MATHTKYVMSGVINTPPYNKVTWTVWDTPDNTGAQSGFSGLIDIQVEYQVIDQVTSSGITGVGAQPVLPDPPTPLVVKIGYIMKATLVAAPHTLITWKVWDSPDFTGAYSGYAAADLENICVDYTEIDDVNRGPQAVPQINELVGPAGGDLTGSYPNPLVVGINGDPIDTTGLSNGYMLVFNGTTWVVQPVGSGTFAAGGDLSGTDINQTVIGLRTKSLSSTLASIGAVQDGYVLTWDNASSSWKALPTAEVTTTLPMTGDVTGQTDNNTLSKIQGITLDTTGYSNNYVIMYDQPDNKWEAKSIDAGGDVQGQIQNCNVVGIRGRVVSSSAPANGDVYIWSSGSSMWIPDHLTLAGDVTGDYDVTTVVKLQNRNVSSAAPTDGYVLTWNQAQSRWEPQLVGSGSSFLAGDVTGTAGANTVVKFQNRPFASTAPSTNDVILWDGSTWKPVAATSLPVVTWANDLSGSTNIAQYVTDLSGGITSNKVTMGPSSGGGDFVLGGKNIGNASIYSTTVQAQNSSSAGDGANLTLEAGNAPSGGIAYSGGHVFLKAGRANSGHDNGTIYMQHKEVFPASTSTTFAEFAYSHITLDPLTTSAGATVTINSGTGGTGIYSSGNIGITSDDSVVIDGTNNVTLKNNGTIYVNVGTAGDGALLQNNQVVNWGSSTTSAAGMYHGSAISSGDATPMYVVAQAADTTANGGNLYLGSGIKVSGTGHDGYVYLKTGGTWNTPSAGTDHIVLRTNTGINLKTTITADSLAGSGSGYVAVNNSGVLSFVSGVTPSGSASGDLSGSYPGPTVAKINGTTISTAGGSLTTGKVLRVTGSATADWGAVDLANSSAVTGTLPTGNQASQSMGGDVSGTTASATVDKIKGKTLDSSIGTAGAGQDQYVITWDNASTSYKLLASSGGGGGITTVGTFDSQASAANGLVISGSNIYAQSATSSNPGMIKLAGDIGGSGSVPTVISLTGTAGVVNTATTTTGITFATTAAFGTPQNILLTQEDNGSVNACGTFTIRAQGTAGGSVTGGDLILAGGDAAATDGAVIIKTGTTTRLTANASGVITIANLSTGVVHADSSGNLTSSAVNLATEVTGTLANSNQADQTMTGDVSGTTNSNTVDKIKNKSLNANIGTAGAGQDQYSIVWDNASTSYKLVNIASGSGVTTVGTIDSQTKSADGAVISGVTIYMQTADATHVGLVSTGTQTFAGNKTLSGSTTLSALSTGIVHSGSGGALTSSAIVNADVDAAAAIAGSKISPVFGAQAITNSSTISVGSTTGNSTIVGGMVFTTRSLSGNLTVDTTTNDNIILVDTSSARTITLPAPSNGRTFLIKDKTGQAETNNITLVRNGTEKIEGVAASRTLSTNWGVWRITTDGTDWFFV